MESDIANQILTEVRAGFDRLDNRIDSLRDLLKSDMAGVNRRFETVDRRLESIDQRFKKVDQRFEKLETEMRTGFHRLETEMAIGFAKQQKASDDIINMTVKLTGYITDDYVGRDNILSKEIATVQDFLSDEFPEKFKAYLKSR